MAHQNDSLVVLTDFVQSISDATGVNDETSRSQAFAPTGYPEKIQVAPGLVMSKPDKFDYAPDIEVADRKIRTLNAQARAGKLAVLNITIEPGSGKTLFLPFKFADNPCLVVLPTVFDAWSAHTANTALTNINVFGSSTQHSSNVTYTDSYHAAYLMSTGEISRYKIVFIDESHSQEGVTHFMASVARPGMVFVRMTASPPTANSRPKKSFPIMEERDVPDISNTAAAADYVGRRTEHRVLVLTPSPKAADDLASRVPRSQTLTMTSPPAQIHSLMSSQSDSALIIADFVCGKGVNLNADCVVEFGQVDTPGGIRNIIITEQLQRKARVGRSKPGVYCSSYVATANRVVDNYSVFRSNLWFILNGLPPNDCTFPVPTMQRTAKLLQSMVEPSLVPNEQTPVIEPPLVTPVIDYESASDSGDTVSTDDEEPEPPIIDYSKLVLDDEPEPKTAVERDFTSPSWVSYYVEHQNHPTNYVADLIYEHRAIEASAILVDNDLVVQKASNRQNIPLAIGTMSSASAPTKPGRSKYALSRVAHVRNPSGSDKPSWATARKNPASESTVGLGVCTDNSKGVKFGSAGHDLSAYEPNGVTSPTVGLGRAMSVARAADLHFDGVHLGGPLTIIRGTKVSRSSRGVGYKAASVCGGYLTVAGVVLSSGRDMHSGLVPLHQDARAALHESTRAAHAINATHYLSWVVTKPLDSLDTDLQTEIDSIKAGGAWSIPPNNVVPTIDLEVEYNAAWVSVVTNRIRNRATLPPIIPRGGFYTKSRRRRVASDDTLDDALRSCDYPCYSQEEQQSVYRAWNIVAVRSASVGNSPPGLYNDAQSLLIYMSSADRLADL